MKPGTTGIYKPREPWPGPFPPSLPLLFLNKRPGEQGQVLARVWLNEKNLKRGCGGR